MCFAFCKYLTNISQVFTPKAAALFIATGFGLFLYFRYEKEKLIEQKRECCLAHHPLALYAQTTQKRSSRISKSVGPMLAGPSV